MLEEDAKKARRGRTIVEGAKKARNPNGKHDGFVDKQAGKQAGRQAGKQAGKQAGRQVGR